tara:strand:- start:2067 stop:2276 length:210 start_codon:yes stop_codon:yes gene_type:complete
MTIRTGRAKYHSVTAKKNNNHGKGVVSFQSGMGRGLVLRKMILTKVGTGNATHCKNCYTSKAFGKIWKD